MNLTSGYLTSKIDYLNFFQFAVGFYVRNQFHCAKCAVCFLGDTPNQYQYFRVISH